MKKLFGLIVAGIDVGSRTTKAVILDETRRILGRGAAATGAVFVRAADQASASALRDAGVPVERLSYLATTGYGRYQVPDRDIQITEITCHAYGAHFLFPNTSCVLDIGAMNSRAMAISDRGRVLSFRLNDKCASGAGRFLERIARGLELSLEDIGPRSLESRQPCPISSICAVLAESEVINLVSQEAPVEDILQGVHLSIGQRIVSLVRQVGVRPEVTLTGGVSCNVGMVRTLEQILGLPLNVGRDAEYSGALGAALFGLDRARKRREAETRITVS